MQVVQSLPEISQHAIPVKKLYFPLKVTKNNSMKLFAIVVIK